MNKGSAKGPILIDLEDTPTVSVSDAAPLPDMPDDLPKGHAMQVAVGLTTKRPSRLFAWALGLMSLLMVTVVSVMMWDFTLSLLERMPIVGWVVSGLVALLLLILLAVFVKELAGFSRLRRMDRFRHRAEEARAEGNLQSARRVMVQLETLYRGRNDVAWGIERFKERQEDAFEADAVFDLAETEILSTLDNAASLECERAARQVATVTAFVPLALADIVVALTVNMRMIRRVAEIYGGRTGALGNWRLTRAVMTHLVATGAVAMGDDMLGSLAGGGLLGKLSRRFGEGVVNGALTARVGVAAMEVCRPLPFSKKHRPSVSKLVRRALTGVFGG